MGGRPHIMGWLVWVGSLLCLAGLLLTVARSAQAEPVTMTPPALAPARGQPDPVSLWGSRPIPAVVAAADAARADAPLPGAIISTPQPGGIPVGCEPVFGPGVEPSSLCRLGDAIARPVVALIGDSHAGTWGSALIDAGERQGFALVPLDKPGCLLYALHQTRPAWPCAQWYQWALAADQRLHPVATIVSFELTAGMQAHPSRTVRRLLAVLHRVRRGVLIVDPPGQAQLPPACLAAPTSTMGTCASPVPRRYVPLMHAIARSTLAHEYPMIPTLQWFCDRGICPMVINNTMTLLDLSHMTTGYSAELGPLLSRTLQPILARLQIERALGARPLNR
jgi:SGNH domain-containing protein